MAILSKKGLLIHVPSPLYENEIMEDMQRLGLETNNAWGNYVIRQYLNNKSNKTQDERAEDLYKNINRLLEILVKENGNGSTP